MKATIEAIEKAIAACKAIATDSVEKTACACHLAEAKRHLENRLKYETANPQMVGAKQIYGGGAKAK
jgi:hypothetical protein